jgi:hypothetical protein
MNRRFAIGYRVEKAYGWTSVTLCCIAMLNKLLAYGFIC